MPETLIFLHEKHNEKGVKNKRHSKNCIYNYIFGVDEMSHANSLLLQ